MDTILKGWPEDWSKISPQLTPYYSLRDELSIYDGLVFKGECLVVPQGLRAEIKKDIQASHAGVEGCLGRARESMYWPGITLNSITGSQLVSPADYLKFIMGKRPS